MRFATDHGPGFREVTHIRGLVQRPEIILSALRSALANATDPRVQSVAGLPRIRVFGPEQLDYRASEAVTHTAYDGSDVIDWLSTATGRHDVCAAFNAVETWSPWARSVLHEEIVAPMVEASGIPPRGLDFYSFIASSGFTPFGVHSDLEPSFIFHLGPATKSVWVWEPETLGALPGQREVTLDIDRHLASADHHFVLEPGDFLSIPGHHFHVFKNDGPAVFLGMSYYEPDEAEELLQAASVLLRRSSNSLDSLGAEALAGQLRQRQNQRANRGFVGAHRLLPAGVFADVDSAEVTSLPIAVDSGRLSVLGRTIDLPDDVSDAAVRALLDPRRASITTADVREVVPGERPARNFFVALLRIGALVTRESVRA
ncbi:hypothetical protein BIU97_06710 [Curtobacterium sp. MCBA15_009]|nr:hypothetical protein BIU92_01950 [Curtobacterium sp. MCBA15_003]OII11566.1 hypothetical protein BIU97_06710 [Curtobacterium sp. MCBA15_009]OII30498.1 hypothetical protein BIU94_06945 [Curtobacterium sp. MMLR14_006]